jgi:shikimate dehydrogenase
MIKACVIGWPIAHSRSPLIHNYWIKHHGIKGHYDKIAVEPTALQHFLAGLRQGDVAGCNVTLPHKENAVALIDAPDDRVKRIGALNTLWLQDNLVHATSSDGPGFIANLISHCPGFTCAGKTTTILGAGGSTRAVVDELLRQGAARIYIHNRTHARAENLTEHFGSGLVAVPQAELEAALAETDLLVNTTSQGMNSEQHINLTWGSLKPSAIVADIVYTPLITPFLKTAETRGHSIVPGLGMLLHQAVIGFEKWFGVTPLVTPELHRLVARDIDPDYQP